jgi:hypothetical protein
MCGAEGAGTEPAASGAPANEQRCQGSHKTILLNTGQVLLKSGVTITPQRTKGGIGKDRSERIFDCTTIFCGKMKKRIVRCRLVGRSHQPQLQENDFREPDYLYSPIKSFSTSPTLSAPTR